MSIISRLYNNTLGRVLSQPTKVVNNENKEPKSKKRTYDESHGSEHDSRNWDYERENGFITKRRRVTEAHFAPIVNGEVYESTLIAAPSIAIMNATNSDAVLMPPPAMNYTSIPSYQRPMNIHHQESMDIDTFSQASASTKTSPSKVTNEISADYDMEKARRYAAATQLPENTGVWERAERDLFFHISLRGFEPLLPRNWMTDFRTLPLSLYQTEDYAHQAQAAQPLIHAKKRKQFSAIRELRELLELGKNVRDKVLADPGAKCEDIIDRAIKKYFRWAFLDADLKVNATASSRKPNFIHVQVRLGSVQTTTECLAQLKAKMHALRAQHFRARNIHESIERDKSELDFTDSEDITQVADSSEDDVPVIYGIMVMKSILIVFTLNSRTPSPQRKAAFASGDTIEEDDPEDDSASDVRYISDFDFSDSTKDVWNAFVVAILAMQIREDMCRIRDARLRTTDAMDKILDGIEEASVCDDDPDA